MKYLFLFVTILCCSVLCRAQATSLTVDNQTPGWLSSKINYGDQQTVRNLTVTGYVNLADLSFIGDLMSKHNLKGHLNLTDAEFVDTEFVDSPTTAGGSLTMFQLNEIVSIERFSIPKCFSEISPYLLAGVQPDTLDYGSERCQVLTKFLVTNRYCGTNNTPKVLILREGLTKIQIFGTDEGDEKMLQTIVLPNSLDSIGNNAFKGCSNLANINLHDNINTIREGAFAETSVKPDTLYLPKSLKIYYTNSFPIKKGQVIVLEDEITRFNNNSWYLKKTTNATYIINKVTPPIFVKGASANSYSDGKELSGCTLYVPKEGYAMYADPEYNSVGSGGTWSGWTNPYSHAQLKTIYIGVESITLNPSTASLNVGSTLNLMATVLPENADNPSLTWTSVNPNVVSVSRDGLVTAIACGNTTIKAYSVEDPNIYATCEISVHQPLQAITLNTKNLTLNVGETYNDLSLSFYPATADNKSVSWQSSNPEIASVDANGRIIAIKAGTSKIVVTSLEDSNIKDECTVTVIQPVTGIVLNHYQIELTEDESQQLIASVLPDDASNKNINWTSSDVSVAMVSPDGTVYAVKEGQASIMATTIDGGFVALCKVSVKAKTVLAESLSLSVQTLKLSVSETIQLVATLQPENVTNKSLHWSSTDSNIATVSDNGLVTGISEGNAQIIVTTTDGSDIAAICDITVEKTFISIVSISFNPSSLRIATGAEMTINAIIAPSDATNQNLKWYSTDPNVATISSTGVITALIEGNTTIIATTQDGSNLSATCQVEVYEEQILVSSIELNPQTINGEEGDTYQIVATIQPEDADNKAVLWSSDNSEVVSVDAYGIVKLKSKGSAVITATASDGSQVKAECKVIVIEKAGIDEILIDKGSYVKIYTLNGVLIYQGVYSQSNLASGTYIVLIDGKALKRIIK